jgi:hypothetical protein
VGDNVPAGFTQTRAQAVNCPRIAIIEDLDGLSFRVHPESIDALYFGKRFLRRFRRGYIPLGSEFHNR